MYLALFKDPYQKYNIFWESNLVSKVIPKDFLPVHDGWQTEASSKACQARKQFMPPHQREPKIKVQPTFLEAAFVVLPRPGSPCPWGW